MVRESKVTLVIWWAKFTTEKKSVLVIKASNLQCVVD